jgi:type VI secretion system protein ImpJ
MKFLSRVVWSEGMHLGPHHFQTQSRYFEDTLWFLNSSRRQYPWGFLSYSFDHEALRNGVAILTFASGIQPDGMIFDFPDCDEAPDPVQLSGIFPSTDNEIVLYLAIPARRDQGLDCDTDEGSHSRYRPIERTLRDDSIGQGEYNVSFARKNLFLGIQAQIPENAFSFPVAKIVRDGKGGFACDPDFIPPCLRIGACENLLLLLHRLAQSIDERVNSVLSAKRSSGRFELGTSALDVANYWFLHALNSALPALRNHLLDRLSHPEEVYRDLVRLVGALSTFSLDSTQDEIPKYLHLDLSRTFGELDSLIRRYLEVVVPSNTVTLEFQQADHYIYTAQVADERCLRRSRWILGVRSSLGDSTLLRYVPRLVKVCSAEGVPKLVQRALPGLELLHVPVPPSALHAQADMHYFSISLDGPCWQHILHTRQVGVYIPGEIGEASFEITVITETQA